DTAFVSEYVDSINAQNADMICFTGDLVNRHSAEVVPFVPVFSRLHASDGVLAVSGNHDYKTYFPWASDAEWIADSLNLVAKEKQMGWIFCDDLTRTIHRGGDSIVVMGLHSFRPPHYKMRADLRAFYPEVDNKKVYKILLQHVPYVWLSYVDPDDELALGEPLHFDLTLSGHTHAMQIQATILGKKISPSRFVSKFWGGKYQFGDQFLYVNTGVGEVGVPMRIGVKPEITVITLKKKQ
ncbi:MAG: metallophosphoesterase, partial [Muribaculaceae bacterium]|nr:metallophosphoesterase [Muribaculaceae bacterium]